MKMLIAAALKPCSGRLVLPTPTRSPAPTLRFTSGRPVPTPTSTRSCPHRRWACAVHVYEPRLGVLLGT
jgi:hypothetical protein